MTLPNYNGPMRQYVPELMGGSTGSPATPLRTCYVTDNVFSTYVVPGDWVTSTTKWVKGGTHFAPAANSSVKWFVDGFDTYAAMKEAFATATGPGHFILLAGWSHALDFPLDGVASNTGAGSGNTMRDIWTAKAAAGVKIRTLLWQPGYGTSITPSMLAALAPGVLTPVGAGTPINLGQNGAETTFINGLNTAPSMPPLALGVWDGDLRDVLGAHHQKILLVYGNQGLIGFFGGVDIYADRVMPDGHGAPQHDVHCRVLGDGALRLLDLFIDRWNACPTARTQEDASSWRMAVSSVVPPPAPNHQMQLGTTIGNTNITYPSDGLDILKNCIATARKFIYMQDQYFWSTDVADALNAAIPNVDHVTIVIPDPSIASPKDTPMVLRRNAIARLLNGLSATDRNKVGIFCPSPAGGPGTYVHSKIWIFDDECAIVGSSNCNNRGYFHDSELMGCISEATIREFDDLDMNFAHKLRMMLWQRHLRFRADERYKIYDGATSIFYWKMQLTRLAVVDQTDDWGDWRDFTRFNSGPHPYGAGAFAVDPR